ncbi:MAG: radical SAM protein [Chloroflexi bacterium]|nr:radical SAM protein [Chloroflexota bacterium]
MAKTSSSTDNKLLRVASSKAPDYFYQRFDLGGAIINPNWPRITTEESVKDFKPRDTGLKLLLINPPIREWSYPNIMPIGQGYVASVATMDGHRVSVLDLNAARARPIDDKTAAEVSAWVEEMVTGSLAGGKPDVIGIGGIITQYGRIKQVVSICKRVYPDVPVVLGGGISSSMPEFMVQRLGVDIAVQGEGEVTSSELFHRLEIGQPLDGMKGIVFRKQTGPGEWAVQNNGIRPSIQSLARGLDSLPWPLRSGWPLDDVYRINPVGHLNWATKWKDGASVDAGQFCESMIASRGCPYAVSACDYCYAAYLGPEYRLRSPSEVVDEMQFMKERYGLAYIHFLDDLMLTDFRWNLEFCGELRARRERDGFEITWGGTCRTNIVAAEVLRAKAENRPNFLEQAYDVGMRQVGYGIESASQTILTSIDKSGQTPERIAIAVKETQRIFGYADCSFMIGSPGESRKTVEETVEVCKQIGLNPEVFFFTTAYPATKFWDLALEKGLIRKAVTGEKGEADDDIIEEYFLRLGEQGEAIRTNFSDLTDEEVLELSWWAIDELGAQNTIRHPHTGEEQPRKPAVRGSARADL